MKLDCVVTCRIPIGHISAFHEALGGFGGTLLGMSTVEAVEPEPEPPADPAPAHPPTALERHLVTIPVDTMAGLPPVPPCASVHEATTWLRQAGLGEFASYSTLQTTVAVLLRGPATALDLGAALVAAGHARTSFYAATSMIHGANRLMKQWCKQDVNGISRRTILYSLREPTPHDR